jgi:hypothetical protein
MAALSGDVKPLFLDEGTAAGVISGDVKPLCM